jgi:hypothetical protein
MTLKKIFILLILAILTNCDYEPIYKDNNDFNLLIKKIHLVGEKKIDRRISNALNLESNNKIKNGHEIKINSQKKVDIVSKDKTGNASVFKITINVNVLLKKEDKMIKEKNFSSSFTYNTKVNKFSLSQYQKNIEANLIKSIAEEIFIFLNS